VLACVVPVAVLAWVARRRPRDRAIMLVTLPLVPVFMWLIGRYTEERTPQRWQALRLLVAHFLDVVRGPADAARFNRAVPRLRRSRT
jgi:ABC-type transport system involved in cytochrome bd biosynthesis fused ATPase/permease subunit